MKKLISFLLIFTLIFGSLYLNTLALDQDVDLDFDGFLENNDDPVITLATVMTESGKDDGYIISETGDVHTAVPYAGNEFIGWYNKTDDSLVSTEETVTLGKGEFVAKFKNNNILPSPSAGYELGTNGQNLLGTVWGQNPEKGTWRSVKVSNDHAKSGTRALMFNTRYQHDIYANVSGFESDTYYIVSYYWMLPKSVITDTATAGDCYYGSAVGSTETKTISEAYNCGIGGDYTGTKRIDFTGGQWNKVEYVFNSEDYEALKIFFSYDSEQNTGNDYLYIDEFTVYKAPDQQAVATYKMSVTAENGYAYSSHTGPVVYNTEVWVAAAPNGGYVFDGWYEDGVKVSDEKLYKFNITANRKLVAVCVPETVKYIPDINNDNDVNLKDLVVLAQYVAKWEVEVNESVVDVDASGTPDLNDVAVLAQYLAGWDVRDQMINDKYALPYEDLNDASLAATLMAGESEYYNKSTVINEGNKARLANVIKKAKRGETITIVGFGGSITEGAKATSSDKQYGEIVAQWFRDTFDVNVNYVNSGIGSTPSLVGIHRIEEHVFAHNPDLVLVDFTTNDSAGDERYRSPYETVLRRILEDTDTAIISVVFGSVSNYSADNVANSNYRANNSLSAHLPSMLYYDVPVIDYFGSLWRYINAGVIKWTDVAGDYIHPSNTGHLMAASAINRYLSDVLANLDDIDTTVPTLPEDYFFGDDIYETATFLGGDDIVPVSNSNFTVGKVHGSKLKKGWVCTNNTGGSITFEIKAVTSLTLYLQYKEGNSVGGIYVNGKTVISNANCNNSSTGGYIWLTDQVRFDEPTDVTVTFKCNGVFGIGPIGVTYAK